MTFGLVIHLRVTPAAQRDPAHLLCAPQRVIPRRVELKRRGSVEAYEKIHDVIVRVIEIAGHFGIWKVPAAVLGHQAEDALPSFVVGNMDHPPEDPPIRLRAEDRRTQDAVQKAIRT